MDRLFTILFLLITLQISASETRTKSSREMIEAVGTVKVSMDFVKPRMENLDKAVVDGRLRQTAIEVPALRKQSKRYRPASTPSLQKRLNWVFVY